MCAEDIKALTDKELRIKVAELLGWKNIRVDWDYFDYQDDTGLVATNEIGYTLPLPDYPQDLNACADMEKSLIHTPDESTWSEYREHLVGMLGKEWGFATARQRCEAFILTMEA